MNDSAPRSPATPGPQDPAQVPNYPVVIEPCAKRVRVEFAGRTIADTVQAKLLLEARHRPVYYFPFADVNAEVLEPSAHRTRCPWKGEASYWSLRAGERVAENAAWGYETPIPAAAAIAGHLAFYWDRVDHWYEEDEEIFGHPRDPHHRVDVLASSREVRVVFSGEVIARSRRALFLFETRFPARYYLPAGDVRMDLLEPSAHRTYCPYKGRASYWHLAAGGRRVENAAWSYRESLPDCPRIRDYLCFYPDRVDRIEVDAPPVAASSASPGG